MTPRLSGLSGGGLCGVLRHSTPQLQSSFQRVGHGMVMEAPGWRTRHNLLSKHQISPTTARLRQSPDWVPRTHLLFSEAGGEGVLQGRVETHSIVSKPGVLWPACCTPIPFSTLSSPGEKVQTHFKVERVVLGGSVWWSGQYTPLNSSHLTRLYALQGPGCPAQFSLPPSSLFTSPITPSPCFFSFSLLSLLSPSSSSSSPSFSSPSPLPLPLLPPLPKSHCLSQPCWFFLCFSSHSHFPKQNHSLCSHRGACSLGAWTNRSSRRTVPRSR